MGVGPSVCLIKVTPNRMYVVECKVCCHWGFLHFWEYQCHSCVSECTLKYVTSQCDKLLTVAFKFTKSWLTLLIT